MLTTSIRLAAVATLLISLLGVSAQDTQYSEPITIGQMGYPHGHQILAWSPTRTTMIDACTQYDAPTRTVIQTDNSGFPSNPICNHTFALDGYEDLQILCGDEPEVEGVMPQITAIATNGTQTHNCTELALSVYPTACDETHITSLWQMFACQ